MEEEKQMTDNEEGFCPDVGDGEDNLSLCNLPIQGYEFDSTRRGSACSDQDLFEFSSNSFPKMIRSDSVVLTRKIVYQPEGAGGEVNEYQKRDYLCPKAASFHKTLGYQLKGEDVDGSDQNMRRTFSFRFSSSRYFHSNRFSPSSQKVNITAITSMSETSRRKMFMFGPVKFNQEMDVISIKQRQGRRLPLKIPPMQEEREIVKSGCFGIGGRGNIGAGGNDGQRKPFWCGSHFAALMAKSFGCLSASMV